MSDNNDLKQFGFEPIEEDKSYDDLSAFGFQPIEEVEAPLLQEEKEETTLDKIISQASGPAIGAGVGLGLQKTGEYLGEVLPEASQRMAARAIGLYDTAEGRKLLKEQGKKLGLPKGAITPEKIGEIALEEGLLGKIGLKGTGQQLEQIDESLIKEIEKKKELLQKVKGTEDLRKVTEKTEQLLGDLDPTLSPEVDKPLLEKIAKEKEAFFDEKGRIIPEQRTALELEQAKTKLQERQKYMPTRSESVGDIYEKKKARALRETVENLVEREGMLEEFRDLKAKTGSKAVMRDVILGKSLKDLKSADIDLLTGGSIAYGRPEIPIAKTVIRKGKGVAAKGMSGLGKFFSSKPVKTALKALPAVGVYFSYQAARAEGQTPGQAILTAGAEEAKEAAMGLGSLAFGELGADELQKKFDSGEKFTKEEIAELNKKMNDNFKEYLEKKPETVDLDSVANSIQSLNEKYSPLANQLRNIQREEDTKRRKAKMHFLTSTPAYKKAQEDLKKQSEVELESLIESTKLNQSVKNENNNDVTMSDNVSEVNSKK